MPQPKNKHQIIFWPLTGTSPETSGLASLWEERCILQTVTSWKEYTEAIKRDTAIAVLAETADDEADEVFSFALQNAPGLLRFQFSARTSTEAAGRLLADNLIHKSFDLRQPESLRALQVEEAHALIRLVEERNRFAELSITDPVTHLTNHRFFQEKIRHELHKAKQNKDALSLIMIDVDHFKLLNDQFGHPRGDQILALIAKELKRIIPPSASLSRYGGEEFALILPKTATQKALRTSEELRAAVSGLKTDGFRLSISLGVASFPEHGLDADELISNADHALYCAKRQGRNMSIVAG